MNPFDALVLYFAVGAVTALVCGVWAWKDESIHNSDYLRGLALSLFLWPLVWLSATRECAHRFMDRARPHGRKAK